MYLNTLSPAEGSKKPRVRVGRGIGSGIGKTSGRGHKGQKSRSGGFHKVGFEGGQMPIQRRLPKFGFYSYLKDKTAEVRLSDLRKVELTEITLQTLKESNLIRSDMKRAKIFLAGVIDRAVHVKGLRVTKGARAAIEAAGGRVEE